MKKQSVVMALAVTALMAMVVVTAYAAIVGSKKEGMVEYVGAQKDIFVSGKAASVVSLEDLAGHTGLYAMGPVDGLDGEITIFDSKPYITQVRGSDYVLDTTLKHGAFFLVWSEQTKWRDVPVPSSVKGSFDFANSSFVIGFPSVRSTLMCHLISTGVPESRNGKGLVTSMLAA